MSRPGSKKLLTTSKALVRLQRRNLVALSAQAPSALHHQQQLLLLGQQTAPSSATTSTGTSPGNNSSSSGPGGTNSVSSLSTGAGSKAGVRDGPPQQPALSFFDFTSPPYHSSSSTSASASGGPGPLSSSTSQSSTVSTGIAVPSAVRPRRESSSSKTPSNTPREPSTLSQQPPSPTQNHAIPLGASSFTYTSPLDFWASEPQAAGSPSHLRTDPTPRLVFEIGAFGIPKAVPYSSSSPPTTKGKARTDPPLSTLDGSSNSVGEDAYFVRSGTSVHALGIADGVGGWSRRKDVPNANAGRFSSLLMSHISTEVARSTHTPSKLVFDWAVTRGLEAPGQGEEDLDPVGIMQKGYERALRAAESEGLQGSATALLALLQEDQLKIANLGDCCLTLIRDGEIFFRTKEMQHSFNQPFQLGTNSRDSPKDDSQYYSIQVETDDLIVLTSDGLTDNIFDSEILEEISSFQRQPSSSRATSPTPPPSSPSTSSSGTNDDAPPPNSFSSPPRSPKYLPLSPQRISEALCSRAKARSESHFTPSSSSSPSSRHPSPSPTSGPNVEERDSPFGVRARKEGFKYQGAKRDDITVLVAIVGSSSS